MKYKALLCVLFSCLFSHLMGMLEPNNKKKYAAIVVRYKQDQFFVKSASTSISQWESQLSRKKNLPDILPMTKEEKNVFVHRLKRGCSESIAMECTIGLVPYFLKVTSYTKSNSYPEPKALLYIKIKEK